MGAVGGISLSVFAAYSCCPPATPLCAVNPAREQVASFSEGMQAIIFFIGQVIINNIDILMVKHYFAPRDAGLYAAIALVGRLLYFATWSVTSAMFPVSAGEVVEQESRKTLVVPLLFVAGLSVGFVFLLAAFPDLVIGVLFGGGFHHGKDEAAADHECDRHRHLRPERRADYLRNVAPNRQYRMVPTRGQRIGGGGRRRVPRIAFGGNCRPADLARFALCCGLVPFFARGKASVQEAA